MPAAQLSSAQVVGAPTIAPQRESVLGPRADTAGRAARPPANVLSRPVVARRAPPAATVPFARQQPALAQNPGRPLASDAVQQMRQGAPNSNPRVRVVETGQVRRVQPTVGASQPSTPQPPAADRRNMPPVRQQAQPQVTQPQVISPPRPPVIERRNGPPGRQDRQQPVTQPSAVHLRLRSLNSGMRLQRGKSASRR